MTTAKEQNASGKQAQQQDQVMLIFLNFEQIWICIVWLCVSCMIIMIFVKIFLVCILKIVN